MSKRTDIDEIEANLARDEARLEELNRVEAALLEDIPHSGFCAATEEANIRTEKQALAQTILRNKQRLTAIKR